MRPGEGALPDEAALEQRGPNRVLHIHFTPCGPEHVDVELRPIFDLQGEIVAYVERLTTVRSASATPSADRLVGRSGAFNSAISALHRVAPAADHPVAAEQVRRASPYWMRHTHATHAVARGAELATVRDNLRHASIATTSIYLQGVEIKRARQLSQAFAARDG